MKRRAFLGTGGAALALLPETARATITLPLSPVLPEEQQPRVVKIAKDYVPNEIHVFPWEFALYWTLPKQRAIRYSVGIGRPGLYEPGVFYIGAKKEWPEWTPTPEMIEREPHLYAQHEDGMPGGPNNPLGARALYLFQPGRGDTFLRIHGTNQPKTIGTAVSNGCARLVNDQIIDLYNRVPLKTRAVLYAQRA